MGHCPWKWICSFSHERIAQCACVWTKKKRILLPVSFSLVLWTFVCTPIIKLWTSAVCFQTFHKDSFSRGQSLKELGLHTILKLIKTCPTLPALEVLHSELALTSVSQPSQTNRKGGQRSISSSPWLLSCLFLFDFLI